MRNRIGLLIGVGLLVALTLVGANAHVQSRRTIWEYKILEVWDEKPVNDLGAEGWELVAVDASRGDRVRTFFKRPKQ